MNYTEGMALIAGTIVLFGALAWLAAKRWPGHSPEPWASETPIVIQYPLDDAPWPKKDGIDPPG